MRKTSFLWLLVFIVPVYLAAVPREKGVHIPADLRDAVASGGAIDELDKGSAADLKAPAVPAPRAESGDGKAIYGSDDRLDYYEASAGMRKLSDSVVSLWSSRWVRPAGDKAGLFVNKFGTSRDLCPGEKFAEQPVGAFCSGTLVGEDLVMTAGHCMKDQAKCADTKFLFGFALKRSGEFPESVPLGDVYGCKRIIKQALTTSTPGLIFHNLVNGGPGPDYALVQLDRKVAGRAPLPVNRGGKIASGEPLFVIGHPMGLPLKVAGGAKVRDTSAKYFFFSDLDTFAGNSGSAVFNARTKLIEGILVRGDKDFTASPAGCNVAAVQPQDGGKGESVTKIAVLEKYIP